MGRMNAAGFAEQVSEGACSLDAALDYHLRGNHYPPHPSFMIPVARAAIEAVEAGCPEQRIDLPEQAEHRVYGRKMPATALIEALHLEPFLGLGADGS